MKVEIKQLSDNPFENIILNAAREREKKMKQYSQQKDERYLEFIHAVQKEDDEIMQKSILAKMLYDDDYQDLQPSLFESLN